MIHTMVNGLTDVLSEFVLSRQYSSEREFSATVAQVNHDIICQHRHTFTAGDQEVVAAIWQSYLEIRRVEYIPIQVQELIFLLRERPGLERFKMRPYCNMGAF